MYNKYENKAVKPQGNKTFKKGKADVEEKPKEDVEGIPKRP